MFFDPLSIITDGIHANTGAAIVNGFISVIAIIPVKPTKKRTGNSDGAVAVYDGDYQTPFEFVEEQPKVVLSIDEIANLIKDVDGEEIHIKLEYKPKSVKNAKLECRLLEKKITAELLDITNKSLKVDILYIENN